MNCTLNFIGGLLLLATSGFAQVNGDNKAPGDKATNVFRYTNPITRDTAISMRDHYIIRVNNKWYCTGTSNPVWTGPNPGVRLLVSDDLMEDSGRRKFTL